MPSVTAAAINCNGLILTTTTGAATLTLAHSITMRAHTARCDKRHSVDSVQQSENTR